MAGMAIALLTLLAAGIGLRCYMQRAAENRLWPGEAVAFTKLHGKLPPNAFLACPPGYCRVAGAAPSPIFTIGADRLYRAFARLIAAEPRIVTLRNETQQRRVVLLQRSAVFGFPDIVTVEIVALGPGRSSLMLYSRARYGRRDFGVNRRRVEAWLDRLRQFVSAAADGGQPD
jgi:uncharacterized protein (DUF1499 family)